MHDHTMKGEPRKKEDFALYSTYVFENNFNLDASTRLGITVEETMRGVSNFQKQH